MATYSCGSMISNFLGVFSIYIDQIQPLSSRIYADMSKDKYTTTYSAAWKDIVYKRKDGSDELLSWVQPVVGDTSMARCGICLKSRPFSISNGGLSQIRQHAETGGHTKSRKSLSGQCSMSQSGPSGNLQLSTMDKDSPLRAEVLQALKVVQTNMSFASADEDAALFRVQFSDSEIAKNYEMGQTKLKYLLGYGIYPHLRDCMLKELEGMPFTFRFDETTTSQVKKQYDGYVSYYSKKEKKVLTRYAGSLFVGKCNNVDLLDHFYTFMKSLKLNTNFLVGLGMDGPSVNKLFETELVKKLEKEKGNSFLSQIGFCVLHTVNNSFGEGLKQLKETINIEQLLIDLFFFFKYSAKRREEYRGMEQFTEVTAEYLLKYSSTRWLYIGKVCVRLMEQIKNIDEYFLKHLPQQKGFNYKDGVGNTERYQRIKKALNNPLLLPTLAFVVYTCNIFKPFVLLFQSKEPLIHLLHGKMKKLVGDVLAKFLSTKHLSSVLGSDGLVKVSELNDINLFDKKQYNVKREVGSKANELLDNLDPLEKKRFEEGPVTDFYAASAKHMIENLPLTKQILIDVKYFHPVMVCKKGAANALPRLAENVWKCLGSSAKEFFELEEGDDLSGLKDMIKFELTALQLDPNLPEKLKKEDTGTGKTYEQPSYWKHAYSLAGIEDGGQEEENKYRRIDDYWSDIADIRDSITGGFKYPKLSKLALHSILILPQGNSDPERGFSINKKMLDVHGSSTKEDTIIALRFIKDELILRGGPLKISLTKELLTSCRSARSSYVAFLEAQKVEEEMKKKKKMEEEAMKEKEKENASKRDILEKLERQLDSLNSGITVALNAVEEGNIEMGEEMKKKKVDMDKLKLSQAKVAMGMKRKNELEVEADTLKKKISKAEKAMKK